MSPVPPGFSRYLSLLLLLIASTASADSILFNVANDTTLLQSNPDNNLGATTNFLVGTTATGARGHGLLRFDIGSHVPAGATITSVSLSLVDTSGSGTFTASGFEVHRMLADWTEGNKAGSTGQTATSGETTWNHRSATNTPWTTTGAAATNDYVAAFSATQFISIGRVTNVWSSTPSLVADVQTWLDSPTSNFGWLLLSDGEGVAVSTARRFASREDALGRGPLLQIDFVPVPEPSVMILSAIGAGAAWFFRRPRRV